MLERLKRFWTPIRLLDAAIVVVIIYVILWSLHPSLVFSTSLITGGDTGAHLALPAYLKTQGNLFNLTPWYPGWFAGMPAYTYYFVLPDILAVLASYVIGFAVAFKLATILGSVLMPITAYAMGRLFRAPRPVPIALALATLPFLFDASFTIDGGNLFSTMAGEYAFSLALALSLLTIGLFARGVRTGRGYWLAAISLSATLASHLLPWIFTLVAVGVLVVFELLARRGIGDPRDLDVARGDYARPVRFAVGAGIISFALSAWWLVSFATTQNLTNSMGYTNDDVSSLHAIFTTLGWFTLNTSTNVSGAGGDRWVIILAGIAVVAAFIVRDRLGMVLASLTVLSFLAFVYDPQSAIWNERLIPFWFISIHLIAGWLFGYILARWIARKRRMDVRLIEPTPAYAASVGGDGLGGDDTTAKKPDEVVYDFEIDDIEGLDDETRTRRRTVRATVCVALIGLLSTVPGLMPSVATDLHLNTSGNQVGSWAEYNYSGYQGKTAWPEYHNLVDTMAKVARHYGCGRAMWEYNFNVENQFGTTMALMLLPYWTNNCVDSMEGLFFESSPTAPYHFLDQAELSASPSNPQVGLDYGPLNVALGVEHLQMLGVKYYMAFSPTVIAQANADPQLQLVATTRTWTAPEPAATWRIYLIKNSPMVQALTSSPTVVAGLDSRVAWLDANQKWWLSPDSWKVPIASSGPSSWPHVATVRDVRATKPLPAVKVRVTSNPAAAQSISFHVSRVGVPVLVKISYFPRWHVTGATGPYRVSPNLMVVVPTSQNVTLTYASTSALLWGNIISDIATVSGFGVLWFVIKRRRNLRK